MEIPSSRLLTTVTVSPGKPVTV